MDCDIPHIIHYCWFGGNEKPELVEKCIASWMKFFPDWEIKEWNETNYDVNKIEYTKEAYAAKKWAFVSDFVRFDVLYEYGGVYLDVDVEFLKPLPPEFLEKGPFTGFEFAGDVAPGLIFAVNSKNEFVKMIIDDYACSRFVCENDKTLLTVNKRLEKILVKEGFVPNNQLQTVFGVSIYPSEYFCGYNTDVREPEITENTICWHHYLGSWSTPSLKMKIQDFLKRIIGVENYKSLLKFVRFIRRKV